MEDKDGNKIIVVDFRKKEKEEEKKKARIYGNIIKRLRDEHISPVNDIDDEPA